MFGVTRNKKTESQRRCTPQYSCTGGGSQIARTEIARSREIFGLTYLARREAPGKIHTYFISLNPYVHCSTPLTRNWRGAIANRGFIQNNRKSTTPACCALLLCEHSQGPAVLPIREARLNVFPLGKRFLCWRHLLPWLSLRSYAPAALPAWKLQRKAAHLYETNSSRTLLI